MNSKISLAFLQTLILMLSIPRARAIFCFKCESYRDFRCLDPFDARPHARVNCDYESFVRDRKPVFCEKTTELVDGVYVTTRGCSDADFDDVQSTLDHRQSGLRCFRSNSLEKCLCQSDNCNKASHNTLFNSKFAHFLTFILPIFHTFCAYIRK